MEMVPLREMLQTQMCMMKNEGSLNGGKIDMNPNSTWPQFEIVEVNENRKMPPNHFLDLMEYEYAYTKKVCLTNLMLIGLRCWGTCT